MLSGDKKKDTLVLAVISLFVIPAFAWAQEETIDIEFRHPPISESEASRTLQSLVKVQGTGGPCQRGLYLLTHFGDLEDTFRKENQGLIDNPLIDQTWRYCSVFTVAA